MYTIMLLDDEPILLDGLLHTVDWAASGFTVVCTARNGIEGIEQYMLHQPDAVLTDIRMRFMDGLEFIRQIKALSPSVEILIMSAYDIFEYARQAVELGALDYLLKPISPESMTASLAQLRRRLDERHSLARRLKQAERYLQNPDEALCQLARKRLLLGSLEESEIACARLDTAPQPRYVLTMQSAREDGPSLQDVPIGPILSEWLAEIMDFYVIFDDGCLGAVLRAAANEEAHRIRLEQCLAEIETLLGLQLTAARGDAVDNILQISSSYHAARERMQIALMLGLSGLSERQQRRIPSARAFQYPYALERELLSLLPGGETERLDGWMTKFSAHMRDYPDYLYITVNSLSMRVLQRLVELHDDIHAYNAHSLQLTRLLTAPPGELIPAFSDALRDWIAGPREGTGLLGGYMHHLVDDACAFTLENYANPDLNLRMTAAALYVSGPYLGRVFKRVTGKSYANYLNETRIDKARALLLNGEALISDIAMQVGFSSQPYFQMLFKRLTGLTPGEFRARREVR